MHVETQIKNRPSTDILWCAVLDSEYHRVLDARFRADGRLINVIAQISEDRLQSTRTMIFRDKAARDAYFGDPIIAVLAQRSAEYDRTNAIRVRTIVDSSD